MSSIFTTKQGLKFGIGACKFGISSNGKSSTPNFWELVLQKLGVVEPRPYINMCA
jgi:hypothetical protein